MEWTIVIFIITLLFNAGMMYKTFKDKPSETRVSEMIDEKFENHCPYAKKISELESENKDAHNYREKLTTELLKENSKTNLVLQRIELNLKRVCTKISVEYLA